MKKALLPLILLAILVTCAVLYVREQEAEIRDLRVQYQEEIQRLGVANQRRFEQDGLEHRKLMTDSGFISGLRATEVHQQEWNRRCAYDPSLASTLREKTILEIAGLSKDKALDAQEILQKVATLAAPRNATIGVQILSQGFLVETTFDMSVMTSGEDGSRTKHLSIESLKREVIEIISRVFKDLYDHCGQKGIDNIVIACTHGVQQSSLPGTFQPSLPGTFQPSLPGTFQPSLPGTVQPSLPKTLGYKTVTKTIYKCSIPVDDAKKVVNWRAVPLHEVADMLKVEHNEFPYLRIVTTTVPSFGW